MITGAELKLPPPTVKPKSPRSAPKSRRGAKREPAGRSAGCTFRNVSEFEPAGRLIDQCRLKNYRIGGVAVSAEHANFIVNLDSGRESDYVELVRHLRCAVAEKHGFYLRPEVKFLNPDALPKVMAAVEAPKINLLLGGTSNEREISLKSGSAGCAGPAQRRLRRDGHGCDRMPPPPGDARSRRGLPGAARRLRRGRPHPEGDGGSRPAFRRLRQRRQSADHGQDRHQAAARPARQPRPRSGAS